MAKTIVSPTRALKSSSRILTVSPASILPTAHDISDEQRIDDSECHVLHTVGTDAMEPTLQRLETYIFKSLDGHNPDPKDGDIVAAWVGYSLGGKHRDFKVVRRYAVDSKTGLIVLTADKKGVPVIVGKPGSSRGHAKPVEIVPFAVLFSTERASKRISVAMGQDEEEVAYSPSAQTEPAPEQVIPEEMRHLFRYGSSFVSAGCLPFCGRGKEGMFDFWKMPNLSHLKDYSDGTNVGTLYGAAARIYAQKVPTDGIQVLQWILRAMVAKGEPKSDVLRGINQGFIGSILDGYRAEREQDILHETYGSIGRSLALMTNWVGTGIHTSEEL